MSSRLIIALIIMLLAPGVQAHNFVTGKTVTPVYIQEGGELLLNSDDEIHYQKWKSTQGSDSNLLIVFYVQIMPDDLVMQLHRF